MYSSFDMNLYLSDIGNKNINDVKNTILENKDVFTSEFLYELIFEHFYTDDLPKGIIDFIIDLDISKLSNSSLIELLTFDIMSEKSTIKLWNNVKDNLDQDTLIKIVINTDVLNEEDILSRITKEITFSDFNMDLIYWYSNTLNKMFANVIVKEKDTKYVYNFCDENKGEDITKFVLEAVSNKLTLSELILFSRITDTKQEKLIINNTIDLFITDTKTNLGIEV